MKGKSAAGAIMLSLSVLVTVLSLIVDNAKTWFIELLLPRPLEKVVPAAELVSLPVGLVVSAWDAAQECGTAFLGVGSAILKWDMEPLITAIFIALLAVLGVLSNIVLLLVSIPIALLAAAIGWLLTLAILAPGITAILVMLGIIWVMCGFIKKTKAA